MQRIKRGGIVSTAPLLTRTLVILASLLWSASTTVFAQGNDFPFPFPAVPYPWDNPPASSVPGGSGADRGTYGQAVQAQNSAGDHVLVRFTQDWVNLGNLLRIGSSGVESLALVNGTWSGWGCLSTVCDFEAVTNGDYA